MLLPYMGMDIEPNGISPPLVCPKEGAGGLLTAHCGSLKWWSAVGKADIDIGLLESGVEYALNVPLAPTNPVVYGGMKIPELRLASLLSNAIEGIEGRLPIEELGEILVEVSEINEGVSVDRFDCTEGECSGVG